MSVYCNARGRPAECEPSTVLTIGEVVAAKKTTAAAPVEAAATHGGGKM
jgi:hypothetical protein